MLHDSSKASTIQVWVCVILAIACAILSFTPLFTLETGKYAEDLEKEIQEAIGNDADIDIPDKIGVSSVKLIQGFSWIKDIVELTDDIDEDTQEELEELAKDEKTVNTLVMAFAIANSIETATNDTKEEDGDTNFGAVLFSLITFLALFYILIATLLFPIIFVITAIIIIIRALVSSGNPEKAARKASIKLIKRLKVVFFFLLCQCMVPGTGFGIGMICILAIVALNVVVNFIAVRSYPYSEEADAYVNIVQFGSLVAALGGLVFFFSIIKSGVLNAFYSGGWSSYNIAAAARKVLDTAEKVSNDYTFDGFLMFLYFILILCFSSYFIRCARRMSLATTSRASGQQITGAVFMFLVPIIPLVISSTKHLYENFKDKSDGAISSLSLSGDSKTAVIIALIGALVALVSEIVIAVLTKSRCDDLSRDERREILNGSIRVDD